MLVRPMTFCTYAVEANRIGSITVTPAVHRGETPLADLSMKIEGSRVSFRFSGGTIEDELLEVEQALILHRTWHFEESGDFVLSDDFDLPVGDPEVFIPSILYKENDRGIGAYPRGGIGDLPSFMEDRTPLPNCVGLLSGPESLWFCTSPAISDDSLSCQHVVGRDERVGFVTMTPGVEFPYSYRGKSLITTEPAKRFFHADRGDRHSRNFYFLPCRSARPLEGFVRLSETFAENPIVDSGTPEPPGSPSPWKRADGPSWDEYVRLKASHLLSLVEEDAPSSFKYLRMGRGNGAFQRIYDFTSASFLVKSIEGAWILARLSGEWEKPELLKTAADIGRFFLEGEVSPGVHLDNFDIGNRRWGGYLGVSESTGYETMVNARCNGESMVGYLSLFEELRAQGIEIPEFLELPNRVAGFYVKNQIRGGDEDGSFGRWWRYDGTPANTLGTNGAYVLSFLIALERVVGELSEYSDAVERAGRYYRRVAERGDFYGDTLDADAYDRESGTALLTAFLDLYERDRSREWLECAELAVDWILTWIWQYDVAFDPNSPLGSRGFRTRGLSSVSVAHHHLDFYGPSIAFDFLRLHEFSAKDLYRNQARAILEASRQLIASERDFLGRDRDFAGWQPEQINHTEWDYFNRTDNGKGTFDICISWPAVLGLGAYLRIRERYPEELTPRDA